MNNNLSFGQIFAEAEQTFEFRFEGIVLSFTRQVSDVMKEQGISKRDLSKKIGCTAPYISKVFSGNPNLTLASMVKIADAIDCDLTLELRPKVAQQAQSITIFSGSLDVEGKTVCRLGDTAFTNVVCTQTNINLKSAANSEFALAA